MNVQEIEFEEIYDIWKSKLWSGRKSEIKPMSSLMYLGGYNMSIYNNYKPTFWGIYKDSKLVAVNSGHRTESDLYRSRGIYVDSECRGLGLASMLFNAVDKQALKEGCGQVWSMPRKGSEYAYLKNGYLKTSEWFDEDVEFGPNCYVLKDLYA